MTARMQNECYATLGRFIRSHQLFHFRRVRR